MDNKRLKKKLCNILLLKLDEVEDQKVPLEDVFVGV